ncbi:hypothetical protein LSH36_233g04016 [Paralvinella palmiformis]|uniref:Uncharacterized protein n=1 Tax=Paralvinella palmiformis TaxID=53620 RepID=A0AAD9JNG7_9ANNE|nr:hypothetical protein LSH36_233g04016 [Paralvinella palmiformis]
MMRKDLNYLNTNCRLSRMLYKLFLMYQLHCMHPLKSKRKVLTDRGPIYQTGLAVMVINIYKY